LAFIESARLWMVPVYEFSRSCPEMVLQLFLNTVTFAGSTSVQKSAILWLFSSVLIQERCLQLVLRAYDTTMGLLHDAAPESELFLSGIEMVMNLLLQGCLKFSDPTFDAAVQRFVQFLQTLWGVSGQCMAALAYLSNFVAIQGMGAVDRYLTLLDKIRDEIVPGFILGVSYKLKGRRYQVPVEIHRRHSDYMWTMPDAVGVQDAVKVFLVQKIPSFQAHTDEVARVIERLAIIGLAKFERDLLPAFIDVARDNPLFCQALLLGCRRFLQNVVHFRAYQRIDNEAQVVRSMRVAVAGIASDVLDKCLGDAGKPNSVTVPDARADRGDGAGVREHEPQHRAVRGRDGGGARAEDRVAADLRGASRGDARAIDADPDAGVRDGDGRRGLSGDSCERPRAGAGGDRPA
jgi:hypothetical protein